MRGLDPRIHLQRDWGMSMDCRVSRSARPGNDEEEESAAARISPPLS
jgi:hypothetical protein